MIGVTVTLRNQTFSWSPWIMHVKDLANTTDKESQVAVGRGVIDFPGLFRTLIDIGYQGQVGLEYEIHADDPLPGMIESIAYMRGVMASLIPHPSSLIPNR